MKIKLLRASNTVKEIEFAATLPPLAIQRLVIDLMFENFERNQTHLWPHEVDTRGSRHEIQLMSDEGMRRLAGKQLQYDKLYVDGKGRYPPARDGGWAQFLRARAVATAAFASGTAIIAASFVLSAPALADGGAGGDGFTGSGLIGGAGGVGGAGSRSAEYRNDNVVCISIGI
jgi:hypothetical protein